MDPETDAVLAFVPELLSQCDVVHSAERDPARQGLELLSKVIVFLRARIRERRWPTRMRRCVLTDSELAALDLLVDPDLAARVPTALLPVSEMADVIRHLGPAVGLAQNAEIMLGALDRFPWDEAPGAGLSGLAAQRAGARLLQAKAESELPSEPDLTGAASAALRGADEDLREGYPARARSKLVDAMCLLFHRERHAESIHSSLVADPATYLGPLWRSHTFKHLVLGGKPPRLQPMVAEGPALRVLVLAGASGSFHGAVAGALSQKATVTVRGPEMYGRFFNRRGVDPQFIETLSRLRGTGPLRGQPDPWKAAQTSRRIVKTLGPHLSGADVVFSDWADRLTVLASHLLPDGVRLVVRIHSLDALHPWFHLVDWSRVDQILVVSEPLRRLATQMLAVRGTDVPVTVVPNMAAIGDLDRPKDPSVRTTLGMIGWGRRVKDPLWALDLLARDPSWRLVLIGRDLHQGQSKLAHAYNEEVRARLRDPEIAGRVEVVGWTDDIASQLTRVGVILSTSRRESWHFGLVEGVASGAVPVVRDWPVYRPVGGARALFPTEWVVDDLDEAEARVRSVTEPDAWESARSRAQQQAQSLFDPEAAATRYLDLILGQHLPR